MKELWRKMIWPERVAYITMGLLAAKWIGQSVFYLLAGDSAKLSEPVSGLCVLALSLLLIELHAVWKYFRAKWHNTTRIRLVGGPNHGERVEIGADVRRLVIETFQTNRSWLRAVYERQLDGQFVFLPIAEVDQLNRWLPPDKSGIETVNWKREGF